MRAAALALILSSTLAASGTVAQSYPSKPIRMIMPVPVGAGVDVIVRKASDSLQPRLGQPLVVENRASANMVTGADACAKAAPDGYSLCSLSALSVALNPLTISKLPYDSDRDFRPIFNMFILRGGLLVKSALPVNSVKEFQALAQAKPGTLNMGTLGPNSTVDISRQWLEQQWNTKITGIPYKGAPLIINAIVAGEVDVAWIGAYNAIGPIKGGRVKLLAIDGARRTPLFPDVPVVGEVGLNGILSARPFWGIFGPARVPDAVARRVNEEFARLFKEPSFVEFLDGQMVDIVGGSPEDFARFVAEEKSLAKAMVAKYKIPME